MNVNEMINASVETVSLPTACRKQNVRSMTLEQFRSYYETQRADALKHDASRATAANVRAVCGMIVGKTESASEVAKRIRCGNNAQHFAYYGATVSVVTVPRSKLSESVINDSDMLSTYGKTDAVRLAICTKKEIVNVKNGEAETVKPAKK